MSETLDGSREGRAKSGAMRMAKLTAEGRKELSARAHAARKVLQGESPIHLTEHSGTLVIGDNQIECAVLEGEIRVLSEREVSRAFGAKRGGAHWRRKDRRAEGSDLPLILSADNLQPFISEELRQGLARVYRYRVEGQAVAHGTRAELLPQMCEVYLKARDADRLIGRQREIALQAEVLIRSLAKVGIIALVDEATGFQRDRAKDALARILEAFIARELQPWIKTFPADYYDQLFRLRGLEYPNATVKRPQYFGRLTNDIIYSRLAPGVLEELKRVTPRNDAGQPRAKYFQSLSSNVGYPKLREHLGAVVALMRISENYANFRDLLDRHYPVKTGQLALPLEKEPDNGKGL